MVESVDTRDLKSLGYCSCAGSSPASSTGLKLCKSETYRAFFFMYAILNFILDYAFFDNKLLFFVQKKVYPIKDTPEYLNLFDYLSYLNNQIS